MPIKVLTATSGFNPEIPDAVLRLYPTRSCSIRRFDAQRYGTTLRA
jgi:hypothetical protein